MSTFEGDTAPMDVQADSELDHVEPVVVDVLADPVPSSQTPENRNFLAKVNGNGFGLLSSGILPVSGGNGSNGIVFDPVQVYCPVDLSYPLLTRASASPPVYVIENFLPAELCERLMQETTPHLVRAPVVGVGNGEISAARTSTTCYLDRHQVPSVLSRVSRLLQGKPLEHIELPQVGRYLQGEEYKAHFDAFDLNSADGRRFAENGGQRVCTVLIYLNDVTNGGQTVFPNLKFALQPKQGRALVFFPATMDGVLDPEALHGRFPFGFFSNH